MGSSLKKSNVDDARAAARGRMTAAHWLAIAMMLQAEEWPVLSRAPWPVRAGSR